MKFLKNGGIFYVFKYVLTQYLIKGIVSKREREVFYIVYNVNTGDIFRVEINPALFNVCAATQIEFFEFHKEYVTLT